MTAWMVVTSVSKSATSWLIDTFITAWSSTMRNCAAARTSSTRLAEAFIVSAYDTTNVIQPLTTTVSS